MADPQVTPRPAPRPELSDSQRSAAESLLNASLRVTASCLKLLAQQQKMLANGTGRRRAGDGAATDAARRHPSGACLTDRYGRRCTDIDVERL